MTPEELVNELDLGLDRAADSSPLKADCLVTYAYTSGPTWKRLIQCYRAPGLHAMVVHRFGQWLPAQDFWVRLLLEPLYVLLFHRIRTKWGIQIGRDAQIGPGCYIERFGGIIVSGGARIGSNCTLSHGVTIGRDVSIAPGAKLFGRIRVGHNVKIGANVVICEDIPDHAVLALAPGYTILSYKGNRVQMATNA